MVFSRDDRRRELIFYVGTRKLALLEGIVTKGDPKITRWVRISNPDGFRNGFVVNLEKAVATLQNTLEQLDPNSNWEQASCHVVLGNAKLKVLSFSSSQYYRGEERTITPVEVKAIVKQTRSVATLPLSEFILQVVPESFLVNDMEGVKNPLGLEAKRLGVNLKVFTMAFEEFRNISKVFEAAEIEVLNYFPKSITVSEAVLTEAEKDEGVVLVDIADDAVQLVLWKNGYLAESTVLPYGSRYLTEQIADRWNIDKMDAERIKEQYASLNTHLNYGEELIPLVERRGNGNYQISRHEFVDQYVQTTRNWAQRMLSDIDSFLNQTSVFHPHLVFSGGGVSVDGFLEFLQKEFSKDSRMGMVHHIEAPQELLVDPSMAAPLGAFRWMMTYETHYKPLTESHNLFQKVFVAIRDWFLTYF